jgi:hypothetical protein
MSNKLLQESPGLNGIAWIAALSALVLGLAGCETTPSPQPESSLVAYGGPPPNTTVYAYPERGQSADQQSHDRDECGLWAVNQTGFDPGAPNIPAEDQVVVRGPPPGTGTAIGAITGALFGAAISDRYDHGAAIVDGGLTGALIGNWVDVSREEKNDDMMSMQQQEQADYVADGAAEYRRAVGACLGARGYSVK